MNILKEITLDSSVIYEVGQYPEIGFYSVNNADLVFVSIKDNIVFNIGILTPGLTDDLNKAIEEIIKSKENTIDKEDKEEVIGRSFIIELIKTIKE